LLLRLKVAAFASRAVFEFYARFPGRPVMFEKYGVWILAIGAVLMLAGWLWLVIRAFRERIWWGLGCLFFPPAAVAFIPMHWKRGAAPFGLMMTGVAAVGLTYGVSQLLANTVDLGKWEQRVDGEIHVTLTDWDRSDYSFLQKRRDIVVLQMANPDVTDDVVAQLAGSVMIKEIDLNDTAITDKSLAILAAIPNLHTLRLRGTKITDAGFREHLLNKESVRSLDLRQTGVASKTAREWKKVDGEGRSYLK
jgi:hypothetical protein